MNEYVEDLAQVAARASSSFHVVSGQFDTVFKGGAHLLEPGNAEQGGAQALDLAAAQGGFVELEFAEAGRYTFVNHAFVDAEHDPMGGH